MPQTKLKETTIIKVKDIMNYCDCCRNTATAIRKEIIALYKPRKLTLFHLKKYLFDL